MNCTALFRGVKNNKYLQLIYNGFKFKYCSYANVQVKIIELRSLKLKRLWGTLLVYCCQSHMTYSQRHSWQPNSLCNVGDSPFKFYFWKDQYLLIGYISGSI